MSASTVDFKVLSDLTGVASINGSTISGQVGFAKPYDDKGLILETTDTALDTPVVPNPLSVVDETLSTDTSHWKRYIWKRNPHSSAGVTTPRLYVWDNNIASATTYLKWVDLFTGSALNASLLSTGTIPAARYGAGTITKAALDSSSRRSIGLGVFNVMDAAYGALGDGVTDDRAAVQAAITACVAAGGGTIYFPPGTYFVNSYTTGDNSNGGVGFTITPTTTINFSLTGSDATIIWNKFSVAANPQSHFALFRFDGVFNKIHVDNLIFKSVHDDYSRAVNDVRITALQVGPTTVTNSNALKTLEVVNCEFTNFHTSAVWMQGGSAGELEVNNLLVNGCQFLGTTGADQVSSPSVYCTYCKITNAVITGNTFDGCTGGTVANNTQKYCGDGMVLIWARHLVCSGNTIRNFSIEGVQFDMIAAAYPAPENAAITGNVFDGTAPTGATIGTGYHNPVGVSFTGDGGLISGNQFKNTHATIKNASSVGIPTTQQNGGVSVNGNNFYWDVTAAGYVDQIACVFLSRANTRVADNNFLFANVPLGATGTSIGALFSYVKCTFKDNNVRCINKNALNTSTNVFGFRGNNSPSPFESVIEGNTFENLNCVVYDQLVMVQITQSTDFPVVMDNNRALSCDLIYARYNTASTMIERMGSVMVITGKLSTRWTPPAVGWYSIGSLPDDNGGSGGAGDAVLHISVPSNYGLVGALMRMQETEVHITKGSANLANLVELKQVKHLAESGVISAIRITDSRVIEVYVTSVLNPVPIYLTLTSYSCGVILYGTPLATALTYRSYSGSNYVAEPLTTIQATLNFSPRCAWKFSNTIVNDVGDFIGTGATSVTNPEATANLGIGSTYRRIDDGKLYVYSSAATWTVVGTQV
jgi:hypothetical protein